MKNLLTALLLILGLPVLASECDVDPSHLGARYLMQETSPTRFGSQFQATQFNLWRKGKEVAHEYPEKQITEIWNLVSDGRIRPVRHFDEYQRAIEYQPSEMNAGRGERDWHSKYHLVSAAIFEKSELISQEGEGCDLAETYNLTTDKGQLDIVWLPAVQLVKSYRQQTSSNFTEWKLEEILVPPGIDEVFSTRAQYQTTDYADIGDNESDPFLLKMINLGFVSHGASGFYNTDGKAMGSGHSH